MSNIDSNTNQMTAVCAVVPTYNNDRTLADVLHRVYCYISHIVVVNDGSDDHTSEVLAGLDIPVTIVSYEKNRGKGYALRMGFEKARACGFRYAVTIDSDGQHFPEDLPLLLDAHSLHPDALIVGSRNLQADNMPSGNTFANKFSNFWFRLQTCKKLPDTQTGYRLYPLESLPNLKLLTYRYEAELELLVGSAWKGVDLIPVGVRVCYPEDRVTHFRPFADFFRISVLNTFLCIAAVLYGYPSMFVRFLVKSYEL